MSDSGSPELPDDPEVSEGEGEEAQDEASESGDERLTQAKQSSKKKVAGMALVITFLCFAF